VEDEEEKRGKMRREKVRIRMKSLVKKRKKRSSNRCRRWGGEV
jgi:hypothetical protein